MTLLVLGIGNAWAGDDGIGPEVVRRVQAEWQAPGGNQTSMVEFQTISQPDLGLLELLPDYNSLIIVDAVVGGAPPGTLHHELWQPDQLDSRGVERASSHGFGVRELLEMAAVLGNLPERVALWGIEIESTESGEGFSDIVAASAPAVVDHLKSAIQLELQHPRT